jgi:cephalosporin hydroxylase
MKQDDLYKIFKANNSGRQINKWHQYFDIYEAHFSKFRNRPIVFLEIGVQNGGSYKMFREYFGEEVKFYGIDVDPRCKEFEEDGFQVFIGSQQDKTFLAEVISKIPKIDIILDDGGHTMRQQIISFEILFKHLNTMGIYLVEDTHTSYFNEYGGGLKRMGTFNEYAKGFVDVVHGYHIQNGGSYIEKYKREIKSVHFYDSVVVICKDVVEKPFSEISGDVIIPYLETTKKVKYLDKILNRVNAILGYLKLPAIYLHDNSAR